MKTFEHTSEREATTRACRVCGNEAGNRLHQTREMFFGTRDPFTYIECVACGTVQLDEIPDLRRYYPEDYYSFRTIENRSVERQANFIKRLSRRLGALVRRRVADYYCRRRAALGELRSPAGRFLAAKLGRVNVGFPAYLKETSLNLRLTRRSSILDVGSGAGVELLNLCSFGFENLLGIDPFIGSDILHPNGVRVLKTELSALERQFDLILANHCLEHVPDPRRMLEGMRRVLKPGRYAIIRIPVVAWAWREYGTNWMQLDPPRHIFLFNVRTFSTIAEEAGFVVAEVRCDSTALQFWGSEQYARDIPLLDERSYFVNPDASIFTADEIASFAARAAALNARGEGDQAAFYLRKNPEG